MGNNPSRPPQQQQQQQQQQQHHQQNQQQQHHQHQNHHLFHHAHSSPPSAHPSPPPANVPARAVSNASDASRTKGTRRNSLQPPASVRYQPTTSLPSGLAPQNDDPVRNSGAQYIPQPRRESIAETVSGPGSTAGWGEKVGWPVRALVDDDDAALKALMAPSRQQQTAPSTPLTIATGRNEDVPPGPALPPLSVAGADGMPRRGSMASTATVDEDDVDVADTRTIPTLIQLPDVEGDRVYVTGTFSNWRKRFKLSKGFDSTWSAVVPLPPGTHHLKFIVDGDMQTSGALPTAVDHTGILVNYLEVNADDMPPLGRQLTPESLNSPHPHPHGHHHTDHPPPQLPAALARRSKRYTNEIPGYLREFVEGYGDDDGSSTQGRRIGSGEGDIPAPPSLPMMLQKVILNTNGAMKDDASVLGIPNHVVLNHLATSSIKQQVLAVSATTRYRKKYVTTILYKATTE